jgi:hypothetical protein
VKLFRANLKLRLFGLFKVPLLFYIRPSVVELNEHRCVIRVPLRRATKNHLGSMYFGALAIGADCAIGLFAVDQIDRAGEKISLVFKSFQSNFIKRPESDVYFICEEADKIRNLVDRAKNSSERQTESIRGRATIRKNGIEETVAEFELGLSLKKTS